jgi:hypothetical protein
MFDPLLPTEENLTAEFNDEIQLLANFKKLEPSVAFQARLKERLLNISTPVTKVSPYFSNIESLFVSPWGKLAPVFLLLIVIGLGGGYYTYYENNSGSGQMTSSDASNEQATFAVSAPSGEAPNQKMMSVETNTVPAPMLMKAQLTSSSPVVDDNFTAARQAVLMLGQADQPETINNQGTVDDQNDFSPIF